MKESNTVAVVFAKEDEGDFKRCTFPILGRPVFTYPLLAALNAESVSKVYISTASEKVIQYLKAFDGVECIKRNDECDSIWSEIRRTVKIIISNSAEKPDNVVILLGNSPCLISDTIDNAVEILDKKPDIDSVVTAEKRHFYNPSEAFKISGGGLLEHSNLSGYREYHYFIDARMVAVRTECIVKDNSESGDIYGRNIHPILQEEGVADIDYPWQVPLVERWLKKNGFSESSLPYVARKQKTSDFQTSSSNQNNFSGKKFKVFISTVPFGEINSYPVDILKNEPSCEYVINPIGRKLKENELAEILKDYNILVAGTEPITAKVIDNAPNLKLISRVGIGLDNVDLNYARKKGIHVSYTPDAPAPAVAELAMGHILNLCRSIALADRKIREGVWQRIMGERLANKTVAIIGTGRVGSRVLKHLQGFSPKRLLVNDIKPNETLYELFHAEHVSKKTIYKEADIITVHVPLGPETSPLISKEEIELMKPGVILVNTSRGGVIHEKDLYDALVSKRIAGAAIDVFETEPYGGELANINSTSLTCHMGSCSNDCRFAMEKLATEEAVRFIKGENLEFQVPEYEYDLQKKK